MMWPLSETERGGLPLFSDIWKRSAQRCSRGRDVSLGMDHVIAASLANFAARLLGLEDDFGHPGSPFCVATIASLFTLQYRWHTRD